MADAKSVAGEIEGDYAAVKIQLAAGDPGETLERPTNGTQVIWGGSDPGSPWAHLASLIEKSGGVATYTFIHGADLTGVVPPEKDEAAPEEAPPGHHDPAPAGGEPPQHHPGGAEGQGPLFESGVDFDYGGNKARVWAHPHCILGLHPLVIYLHGINGKGRHLYPALDDHKLHVGKLANQLIEDGKVTPLLIAAPSDFSDGPWGSFDLGKFVDAVEATIAPLRIDRDRVGVVGHSGAGGSPGRGLNRIAEQHGTFGDHRLKLFGIADTCITDVNAAAYRKGLEGNSATEVYALHKGTGGWPGYTPSAQFAKALGAASKCEPKDPEQGADIEDAWDSGGDPKRISLKIKAARLGEYHKAWRKTGGYKQDLVPHEDMVPMWTWYALPRFFPATEDDKHAGFQPHDVPPMEPEPLHTPATGGEWAHVPPAPPPWDAPEAEPRATPGAEFADPASAIFWPVRNTRNHMGRAVCFVGTDNKGHGLQGGGACGRNFLADRPAGSATPDRFHAGIDVFADYHDLIVACEAGTVIQVRPFYLGVWKVMVRCDSGIVINYGEVDADSIRKHGLKTGDRVQPGQPIAEAGRMLHDSMLHFEIYPPGSTDSRPYFRKAGAAGIRSYLNPSQYLLALAKSGR